MRLPRSMLCTLSVILMATGPEISSGQSYPLKSIRMVAPEAGGGGDFAARLVAQGISGGLGQQIVVENQGGAGGIVAAQTVAKAPADGYTVLFHGNPIWFLPLLQTNVPYDPVRDLSPVILVDISPLVLVTHPTLLAKTVKELIALAKARPGALNYAAGVTGATPHLSTELFKSMAKVDIVRITYKGTGPALNDMISGQVQMMFTTTAVGMPHVKTGRLYAMAVTSPQPSALVPGLPTLSASGLPGYESLNTHGMFAPAKTPAPLINRLNQETVKFLNLADTKERFLKAGIEGVGSSPEAFLAAIKSEITVWGKLIKDAGIRVE